LEFRLQPAQNGIIREFSRIIDEQIEDDQTALLMVPENDEALRWRLALVDSAKTSLDIQYFLWDNDRTSKLLMHRLILAADRGVKVRILVDDIFTSHPDLAVASLSEHPNLEIRIFNPNPSRSTDAGAAFRYMLEVRRLNRRMHNKLFIADGRVSLIGGRNIGDAYFGLASEFNFVDLDVLAVGDCVEDMSTSFDLFWNSPASFPGTQLHKRGSSDYLDKLRANYGAKVAEDEILNDEKYIPGSWVPFFHERVSGFIPAYVRFVSDHPYDENGREVTNSLVDLIQNGFGDIIMSTPYFIPGLEGIHNFADIAEQGTGIRLLVPSLGSINHTAVHSHYRKYRKTILESGIEVFEYKHNPMGRGRTLADMDGNRADFISMHMKVVVAGASRAYVGSLNLDHRAMRINTENGLIIDSKEFAQKLRSLLESLMTPEGSWQLTLKNGRILWESEDVIRKTAPARSVFQRIPEFLFRFLPIETML
jgi:cardiolipin synthase C